MSAGTSPPAAAEVMLRLALAAARVGRMPHQVAQTASAYHQLAAALEQHGLLQQVTGA